MFSYLLYVHWSVDEKVVSLGESYAIRWYGLLFASAFLFGYYLLKWIYHREKYPLELVDKITLYMVLGTVVGARLGHCLFYEPEYYLNNPVLILAVWQGGLASHGAAIGILIALWLYFKKTNVPNTYIGLIDSLILTIPIGGAFVRIGNLMNSEIYGKPTDVPWAFIFEKAAASMGLPRHPTQIYEALIYVAIFVTFLIIYRKTHIMTYTGMLSGGVIGAIFLARFFVEFLKEPQEQYVLGILFNTGQLLSIPFVLLGIWLIVRGYKSNKPTIN